MVLSEYLAKNYLSASTATATDPSNDRPTKKRKKNKHSTTDTTSSLLIADDEDLLLSSKNTYDPEDENDTPLHYDTKIRSAEFRKSKKNGWKSVVNDDESNNDNQNGNTQQEDESDALLRQTIASNTQAKADLDAENAPTVVDGPSSIGGGGGTGLSKMSSGVKAGLQTAADTARLLAAEQEAQRLEEASSRNKKSRKQKSGAAGGADEDEEPKSEQETIYRDATGRRIDLSQRRADLRAAAAAKIAAEKKAREDAMGEVQLRAKQERKQELEDAKFLTLGRTVDDDEYNAILKDKVLWDDPMAAYMARKHAEEGQEGDMGQGRRGGGSEAMTTAMRQKNRKKEYSGPAAPNRYGIRPGWRWDGVDRGNGFEKDWFQARGRKSRNENLEYQWQMDE